MNKRKTIAVNSMYCFLISYKNNIKKYISMVSGTVLATSELLQMLLTIQNAFKFNLLSTFCLSCTGNTFCQEFV